VLFFAITARHYRKKHPLKLSIRISSQSDFSALKNQILAEKTKTNADTD
jgi:hypothetical protein